MRLLWCLLVGSTVTLLACSSDSTPDSCTEQAGDGGAACTVSGGAPGKSFTCSGEAKPPGDACNRRATVTINGQKTTSWCCP